MTCLDSERINDPATRPRERLELARRLARTGVPDLDAVCAVDLHLHSFYSDGYHSPSGRVWEAWRRGLRAISITDHDNLDAYPEAVEAGRVFGVDLLPGVEFYTDRSGIEIIGYWPDTERFLAWLAADGGREVIEPLREAKRRQLAAMVARVPACMRRHGLEARITADDIERHVRNGLSTKGDISVIMWQKYGPELARRNIAANVKDFQTRYTTNAAELDVPLHTPVDISPGAWVRRLAAWGALPGISHPTELRKREGLGNRELDAILDDLGAAGLRLLEVDNWRSGVCPETGRPHPELFLEMIARYNARHPRRPPLLPTCGSDDHNQPGEGLEMGCGRDRNMRPELCNYAVVAALRESAELFPFVPIEE